MAKVIILGASGNYGREIAKYLQTVDAVEDIGLLGRNGSSLSGIKKEIGEKAKTIIQDVTDINGLMKCMLDYDYVCNVTGHYSESLEKVLLAAIETNTNYLDISEGWKEAETAFSYDEKAIKQGVMCVHGIGSTPGVTNLLAKHVIRDMEDISSLHCGFFTAGKTYLPGGKELKKKKQENKISSRDCTVMEVASGDIKIIQNGKLELRPAMIDEVVIKFINDKEITVYPINMSFPLTMSKYIRPSAGLSACMAFLPDEINKRLRRYAGEYSSGEVDMKGAVFAFFEDIADVVDSEILDPGFPVYAQWAFAKGMINNKPVSKVCTPNKPLGISATLTSALQKMMDDKDRQSGVHAPEDIYNPLSFLTNVYRLQYGDNDFELVEKIYDDSQE